MRTFYRFKILPSLKGIDKEEPPELIEQPSTVKKILYILPSLKIFPHKKSQIRLKYWIMVNFLRLSPLLASGGSPTLADLENLRGDGCEVVINLALPTSQDAIPAEDEHVHRMGMQYIPIPVVWENPTRQNAVDFFDAMDACRERSVFVHCVKNMRVSAFIYLYRILRLGADPQEAYEDMAEIWEPEGTWAEFIQSMLDRAD